MGFACIFTALWRWPVIIKYSQLRPVFPLVGGMKLKLIWLGLIDFLPEIAFELTRLNWHITLGDHVRLYLREVKCLPIHPGCMQDCVFAFLVNIYHKCHAFLRQKLLCSYYYKTMACLYCQLQRPLLALFSKRHKIGVVNQMECKYIVLLVPIAYSQSTNYMIHILIHSNIYSIPRPH